MRADGRIRKSFTNSQGKRIYFYGYTEREVEKKMFAYREEEEKGKLFSTVAREWWYLETSHLSPSTAAGYKTSVDRAVEHFGQRHIKEIKTADITRYLHHLARRGLAKKTVKNHLIVVSRIFHYAVVECYITVNPAREAELPRGLPERKRPPALPSEEMIIQTEEVWLLPYMALLTGMRKGELLGLRWEDIDLNNDIINVRRSVWYGGGTHIKEPKTEAGKRRIPLLAALKERILTIPHRPPHHYVFGDDKPLSEKAYRYRYAQFQKQTGVTATVQQLRKSFATYAVSRNIPPDVFKVIFGHRDITTTLNIYAEVREDRIKEAGKLLEL